METTTNGAEMFTEGLHYAIAVNGASHGFCNAKALLVFSNKVLVQPCNLRGEPVGTTDTVYFDEITEVEER